MTVRSNSSDKRTLLEEMRAEARKPKGPPCGVGQLLRALNNDEHDQLQAALVDRGITASVISDVLARHGHRVGHQAITRHRSGRCACGAR